MSELREFHLRVLALMQEAEERDDLPPVDRAAFCGAAKDLLLAAGLTWDENRQEYVFPTSKP